MLGLMRDLFVGLLLLGLLMASPWLAEQVARQNSESDLPETTIVSCEPYFDLTVSRKNGQFAAVGMHGQVTIGRMDDPAAELELDLPGRHVMSLQFSPREFSLLLGCLDGTVLWQPLEPFEEPHPLAAFSSGVSAVSVSADGRLAAMACSPFEDEPAHISIVEISSAVARVQSVSERLIVWLSFTGDGRELLCRDSFGSVLMIDAASGKLLRKVDLPGLGTGPAALSPSGRWLAVGGVQGQVAMIDLRQRRVISQWPVSSMPISSLEFSLRGTMLACGTRDQLMLLNGRDHKMVAEQATGVNQLHFSGNGKKLITSGHDGTIRRWSLPNLIEEQRVASEPL
ncbi:MAG: hypothetical protein IAG10_16595 [Planctomycetaceae bacterium]|nr:hypothetical protein [Planctomycetaceae bacterium]